jgi:hypothetical protein
MIKILIALALFAGAACTHTGAATPPSSCASSIARSPDGVITGPFVSGDCGPSIGDHVVPPSIHCPEDAAIVGVYGGAPDTLNFECWSVDDLGQR